MLTSDLLRTRMRGGEIRPIYIDPADPELLDLAGTLIDVVQARIGSSRGELQQEYAELLGTGTEYILHRGLIKLIEDRCEFETASPMEPRELRLLTFRTAAAAWRATQDGTIPREQLLQQLADSMNVAPEDLEQGLYADLKDEQVLSGFKKVKPEWLLNRYNVALAQAVLFKATRLEITLGLQPADRFRAVFRKMKFFQLMYEVSGNQDDGYQLQLDGPISLFKSSQKYGLQMASFLPTLLHCENWSLSADLLWGKGRLPKKFTLSSELGLQPYGFLSGQWQPEEMQFLLDRFPKQKTEWQISQDADLVNLSGQGILVPDYVFTHPSGMKVYLELFGFWRKGALHSRLQLLRKHGPRNFILGIARELAVDEEELTDLPNEVYQFRSTPIAPDLVKLLDGMLNSKS